MMRTRSVRPTRQNVWFGARVTVLDGVHISDDVVVGACSLVSKNITEAGVYVGTPAKKLQQKSKE